MKFLVPALAAVSLALPALAAPAPAPKENDAAVQANDDSQNRMVCKREKSTGSRLGSKRVCMTEAQWAQRAADERQAVERAQNQRYKNN